MAITEYGKLVRKLRIEVEKSTKEMADSLGVTPAYLSALETGKKNIPTQFIEKVAAFFFAAGLKNNNLLTELREAAFRSQKSFELLPEQKDRELVAAFARKFPTMAEDQKQKVLDLLKELT